MGQLITKTSSLNRTADYLDTESGIQMSLNYLVDDQDKLLNSISGTIYKGDHQFAGNFNGNRDDGEINYSISGVKRADLPTVYAALTDIEEQIAAEFTPDE